MIGGSVFLFAIGRPTFAVILGRLAAIFLGLLLVDWLLMAASLWRSAWSSWMDRLAAIVWVCYWLIWRHLCGGQGEMPVKVFIARYIIPPSLIYNIELNCKCFILFIKNT